MSNKKYFFKGAQQSGNWYGLISSNLNRIYLVSNNYQRLKILQLCFMRHELFYIVDLCQLKSNISIDNSSCLNYTLSNAQRLHLELDVEIRKLKYCDLIKKHNDPSEYDLDLQTKLFFCYYLIEHFEEGFQRYHEVLMAPWKQEAQGLEITKRFVEDVFDDQDFFKIINRDLNEILFSVKELDEFRKKILKILAFADYDKSIDIVKKEIEKKIEIIDVRNSKSEIKKIPGHNKITDIDLCHYYISKNNYNLAQEILKEKLKAILLLLLK